MENKLVLSKSDIPIGAFLTCQLLKVDFDWGDATSLNLGANCIVAASYTISRHLARVNRNIDLYPSNVLNRTEVDHWLTIASGPLSCKGTLSYLKQLNLALAPCTYLVNDNLTIADLEIFSSLYKSDEWNKIVVSKLAPSNVLRWYNTLHNEMKDHLSKLPQEKPLKSVSAKKEDKGKFVDLPGAKMGEVVVRFPPEASGYLHIGHAKAALLNQYYQQLFKGKLIMRFDDTNPAKEKLDFEKVILEDLKLLQIYPDVFTHTSDHFNTMADFCEQMIKDGSAYADDTDAETMKKQRESKEESVNRSNSVDKNLSMWEEMKKGSEYGQKCCIRAKIDMKSLNGCMRDPTIYRCKNETHVRTGNAYKVYPTYDFACPIVDSIEGVTHALRTTEYHDRDDQYDWFIKKLNLRPVHIYEYSRLNMNNTVLSKRRLTWFVDEGLVDGWNDPRFPTVRGILRKGMTIEGLKEFIIAQGSSRSIVNMEWDKIWSFNKKVIDRNSSRYTALQGDLISVYISGVKEGLKSVQKHPKDPSKGMKNVFMSNKVFIESVDAEEFKEGTNVTFINWGNIKIKSVKRDNGKVVSIEAEPNVEDTDYKKTLKVTWLAESGDATWTPLTCVEYGHLINKSVLGKDEDFKQFIGHVTKTESTMVGESDLKKLEVGDIIQLQRKGFYRVDEKYEAFVPATCSDKPMVLIAIPDGHTKDTSVKLGSKELKKSAESKLAEKSPVDARSISGNVEAIHSAIIAQGDKIRQMKADKAEKLAIKTEVDTLLSLKKDFKLAFNVEWKPDIDISQFTTQDKSENMSAMKQPETGDHSTVAIHEDIKNQGDKIRTMKADKADKAAIKSEVDNLLSLKTKFKHLTNMDWKPNIDISQFTTQDNKSDKIINSKPQEAGRQSALEIHEKIKDQGDQIRALKASKADKTAIKSEVDNLLSLKAKFKDLTNMDWKPDIDVSQFATADDKADNVSTLKQSETGDQSANQIHEKVKEQGDKIRNMKTDKADKAAIKSEVDILLNLKANFKSITNTDWTPNYIPKIDEKSEVQDHSKLTNKIEEQLKKLNELNNTLKKEELMLETMKNEYRKSTGLGWNTGEVSDKTVCPVNELLEKIKQQGDKVRNLKNAKAGKDEIKTEVTILLNLKADYKNITGNDWKPDSGMEAKQTGNPLSKTINEIHEKIKSQGDKIRNLKSSKASKDVIKSEVEQLLALKDEFKAIAKFDWKPDVNISNLTTETKLLKGKPEKNKNSKVEESSGKKQTRLGIEFKKHEDLPEWYSQVITKSDMIEYYNVSGCYVYRYWSYAIWEVLKYFFDVEIKRLGVQNEYYPMLVSKSALEKEKSHIEDFSPEVAWVTKAGDSDLAEPVAIRPTSETVMYPSFSKWVQSHRDLPIRVNQWNNVVRWEFKQATPFLRTREFLWQEGHTAFATEQEAVEEVYVMLDLYRRIYEEYLAIPVVKGRKTKKEQFAGSVFTTTTEAFISVNGRAIQGATSHHLGQNFSKMCDISFQDPKTGEKLYAYQNSWGFTTRTIGVLVMVHGDDKGLVLPPKVAPIQVIILPVGITAKTSSADKEKLINSCQELLSQLVSSGIKAKCDLDESVTPSWKFNKWELKGVPLRIELGPREVASNQVFAVRRDTSEKQGLDRTTAVTGISNLLDTIQQSMYEKAKKELDSHIVTVTKWNDFMLNLDNKNLMLTPFCGDEICETNIKADSTREVPLDPTAPSMGAKSLCIPMEQPASVEGCQCINPKCQSKPQYYVLFGRSY